MSFEASSSFVGREDELHDLRKILLEGMHGHGNIVFIMGEPGGGKTHFVNTVQQNTGLDEQLRQSKFLVAKCFSNGENDAYHPFAEIVRGLRPSERGGVGHDWKRKFATILTEAAPEVINLFVPGAIGSGVKVAKAGLSVVFRGSGDEHYANLTNTLGDQFAKVFIRTKEVFPLLVLIIKNCQWIDRDSCELLSRLARPTQNLHVVIITTCQTGLGPEHPFSRLMAEMKRQGLGRVFLLKGLDTKQIDLYIRTRFNGPLDANLAPWLEHLCKGNPLIVTQYLSLLQQTNIIRREGAGFIFDGQIKRLSDGQWEVSDSLAKLATPASVDAVLAGRIGLLPEETTYLLKVASVQGERFMSTVLSDCMSTIPGEHHEKRIIMQLGPVMDRHHIVSLSEYNEDEWAAKRSAVYLFDHALLQQQFYTKLIRRERDLYHGDVAKSLEKTIQDQEDAPRRVLLDVGHHADKAGNLALAARFYEKAAQSSFSSGGMSETVKLCELALNKVRNLSISSENDKLRAGIILLRLSASELWWRGKSEQSMEDNIPLQDLVAEAEDAARRSGDQVLLSRAIFLKGKILTVTGSLTDALNAFQEALDTARGAGDTFGEFMIMSRFGHQLVSLDLDRGIQQQYDAHKFFQDHQRAFQTATEPLDLEREFYQLKGWIGVGELDRGNLGKAVNWLNDSIKGLETLKSKYELAWMLNFLGQAYTTMGRFEEAEGALQKSVNLHKDEQGPIAVRGYSLTELGKLYLEWGRVHEAVNPILNGWKETLEAANTILVPLARIYYAELLMHPESEVRDLALAGQEIDKALDEAIEYKLRRSEIVARSLLAQLSLINGDKENALVRSTQAVKELEKTGREPHVREEEIFFNHYLVLEASGRDQEAQKYLEKSSHVLDDKAASIPDTESRDAFLKRVPTSQQILAARMLLSAR